MKKFFTVSFLILGIISMSGCSLNKQKPIDKMYDNDQEITSKQEGNSEKENIYNNKEIGFTLKYPKNWKTINLEDQEDHAFMAFIPTDINTYKTCIDYMQGNKNLESIATNMYCSIRVVVNKVESEKSLKEFLLKYTEEGTLSKETQDNILNIKSEISIETLLIKGFSFTRNRGFDGISDLYTVHAEDDQFIFKKGNYVVFITNAVEDEEGMEENVFNEIVESIEFYE